MDQGCVIEVINKFAMLFWQTNSKTQKKQLQDKREKIIYLNKKNLKTYTTRETFVQYIYNHQMTNSDHQN